MSDNSAKSKILAKCYPLSILSVVSMEGSLASKVMKKAYNDNKKTSLVDTLGAFLVTRDLEGYAMIGLDKTNHIRCISCGYPTLGGFAPEKHSRFDRWQTCSFECW